MMKLINSYYLCFMVIFFGCQDGYKEWKYMETLSLGKTTPIGLAVVDDYIWIADGDNNQLIQIDFDGNNVKVEEGFERPMHIVSRGDEIYIPEYGKDQVTIFTGSSRSALQLTDSLDAPAGVYLFEDNYAIADFYNHRVLLGDGSNIISIGKEGHENGEFYYPTDVHIYNKELFVADAYNNRIQVFDMQGNFIRSIGQEEKMNAATGIFVDGEIFITDFENNRVLIYSLEGELMQIIDSNLDKPTDILIKNGVMYIANYKGKNLVTFKR